MRALAHIEKIEWIKPIEGADRIVLVGVLGWQCVARVGEFKVGDLCVYHEIDSKVDVTRPCYAFMEKRNGKVKTIKLKGVLSQGLALPLDKMGISGLKVGSDVTKILGITKIETQEERRLKTEAEDPRKARVKQKYGKFLKSKLGKFMMRHGFTRELVLRILGGKKKNRKAWPEFITKTDEERVENHPEYLENKEPLIVTEKLDGTSSTYFVQKKHKKYEFGVCSRNVRQFDEKQECYHDHNIYWDMAFKYNIEKVLKTIAIKYNATTVVLQGESVGSVQGNPLKLPEDRFYGFNLIVDGKRLGSLEAKDLVTEFGIDWVPILDTSFVCPDIMEEMKKLADGRSAVNPDVLREGLVLRSVDGRFSFKNVSNKYLLRERG